VVLALRGRWALMLRTAWVVVLRMVRVSSPARSMVMVCSATWTVTTTPAWMRPRAIFCPATMMTPVLLARRWAVMGSAEGRGGGPAGLAPQSLQAWSQVSGLGRVSWILSGWAGRTLSCLIVMI
jgi:hypothetical protein